MFLKFNEDKNDKYDYIKGPGFRLNFLKIESNFPFLMCVLSRKQNSDLSENEVQEIFAIVESFLARRIICNTTNNGLNRLFIALDRDVESYLIREENTSYVEVLKYLMLEKSYSQRFPSNKEVASMVPSNQFYSQRNYYKNFILSSIDDQNQKK